MLYYNLNKTEDEQLPNMDNDWIVQNNIVQISGPLYNYFFSGYDIHLVG